MGVLNRPGARTPEPGFLRKPMSANTSREVETAGPSPELTDRDARALTEYMTVLPKGGDVFTVVGQNGGGEYRVDAQEERCTCPDHKHRGVRCKHIRRVAFATGEEAIPSWADREEIDDQLGEHVSGTPEVAAADGGVTATPGEVEDSHREEVADLPNDADAVTVADTGAGLLVFVEADLPGQRLAGFADVTDWAAIRDALRARGLGVGATTNLPVFELGELPQ